MPIQIVRNEAGNCITFRGSSNPTHFNACLSGEVDAADSSLVNVINDIQTAATGNKAYEFYNIPYTEWRDASGNAFASATAAADYITVNGNVAAPADVNIGYKGVFDASGGTAPSYADPVNGDWYYIGVAGTIASVDYEVNDIIKYSDVASAWEQVKSAFATVVELEESALDYYDHYVDGSYTGTIRTGTSIHPYNDLATAIAASSPGDSIFVEGTITAPLSPSDAFVLPHGLNFYGADGSEVKFAAYASTNGDLFYFDGTDFTQSFKFANIKISNAGGYGIFIKKALRVEVEDCVLKNNGWNGSGISTTDAETGGVFGYDSQQADLQAFYAGPNASDGGAIRIETTPAVDIVANEICENLRGILIQDCGVSGAGVLTRNRCYDNVKSGLSLSASSGDATTGCENFSVYNNLCADNAGSGIYLCGGTNNIVALNRVQGNWNAGVLLKSVSDTRARDMDLDNNNRSEFDGAGDPGEASASIHIGGSTIRSGHTFLAEVLDTTIHNTGTGSSVTRNGLLIANDVAIDSRPLINLDDVAFINQDYAVVCDADANNIRLTISDCRYIGTTQANVYIAEGFYHELPYSNAHVNSPALDFSVDPTGSVIKVKESNNVIQTYSINDLQAIANGTKIRVIIKGSNRIQFDDIEVAGCSISGVLVNSVLADALVQLNNLFSLATGFSGGSNPVTGFALTNNDLTITLQDGSSYTVDVTTLGVDENNFVSSGALSGSDLVLTMSDGSTVTIDASNMINGSQLPARAEDWYIAYGTDAGDVVTTATIDNAINFRQPFYNGDFLEKGEEYIWTHDGTGSFMIGVWSGAAANISDTDAFTLTNWSTAFRFVRTTDRFSGSGSVGVDTATRLSTGDNANVTADGQYDVTGSTVLALRYGQDNHLYLIDISDGGEFIIGKSNTALVGSSVTIFFTGESPEAKFPVMVKRFEQWTIVHDFDSSENGEWNDGVETDTVIKSNMSLSPGEKMILNFNYFGRSERIGLGYNGASSGVNNAPDDIIYNLIYGSAETLKASDTNTATGGEWTWNQSASAYYNPNGNNSNVGYWNGNGSNLGLISFIYNSDNSLTLYHEGNGEEIATLTTALNGSAVHIYLGFNESHPSQRIPAISRQDLVGNIVTTSFAPDISDQSFDVDEGDAFNIQISLDAGSDIVNQYGEVDAPSWAVLNQSSGVFSGTAPAYTGSSDSYVIQCKAANALGGSTSFNVTINVQEVTYTNTKSLSFVDGVSSYLGGNAALITSLERAANGSGSSDAWSISLWFKRGTSSTGQTIFYFGSADTTNGGIVELRNTNTDRLRLRYGSSNNYVQLVTPVGGLTTGWHHILVTYDGGTTGASSADLSLYYSRFKIFIDGVQQTTSNSHSNFGWSGAISGQNYRVGRYATGQYLKNGRVNQIAIWGSDQSGNVSTIYNGGSTQDLSLLASAPSHYYEIETSTSSVVDLIGTAHFVGYNFSSTDLVNDAP